MEIVKTEAEERTFVQKLLDTSWPALHPIVGQLLGRGGQAVVYKLTFADGHSEALKVIDTSVYRDPARRKDANRRGRSEIQHHQQLTAKTETVVRLFDTASIPLSCERGQDAPMCFLLRICSHPLTPKIWPHWTRQTGRKPFCKSCRAYWRHCARPRMPELYIETSNAETFS